jgi:hypothetical protein
MKPLLLNFLLQMEKIMNNKKRLLIGCLILIISVLGIKHQEVKYLFSSQPAQTLKELAYDHDKRHGYTIYVPENNKLEPYYVLTDNYADQGNVLLMRKYLLDSAIPYKEKHSNSYYGNSLPDRFMNEVFIQEFPEKLRDKISKISLSITDEKSVINRHDTEKIKRKVFTFLQRELDQNDFKIGNEKTLKYFSDEKFKRFIGKLKTDDAVSWWLRGVDQHRRDNFAAISKYNGYTDYAEVMSVIYIRPSFCLAPDTKIVKEKINGKEVYVLETFQNLPKADVLVEKIGLKYPELQEYYVNHDYVGVEVEIKQPQYGGYLLDKAVVPRGKNSKMRALPYSNGKFDGWYIGDKLISTEQTLSYQVTKNETLTAKFSPLAGAMAE